MLTPRQVEVSGPKSDEARAGAAATAQAATTDKTEPSTDTSTGAAPAPPPAAAPKPPDRQSAHALFWGRADRAANARGNAPVVTAKARPFSADAPRLRFQRSVTKSTHSSKQYQRHLAHLLPAVRGALVNAQSTSSPHDTLERIAEHLQRRYHRPSMRFALAQCNIFPATAVVPTSTLSWICTPDLVAATTNYVRALDVVR